MTHKPFPDDAPTIQVFDDEVEILTSLMVCTWVGWKGGREEGRGMGRVGGGVLSDGQVNSPREQVAAPLSNYGIKISAVCKIIVRM